jgi:hypothetical protein
MGFAALDPFLRGGTFGGTPESQINCLDSAIEPSRFRRFPLVNSTVVVCMCGEVGDDFHQAIPHER